MRGADPKFLRALRRKYGLGEFKRRARGRTRVRRAEPAERETERHQVPIEERFPAAGIDEETIPVFPQARFGRNWQQPA